MGDAGKHDGPQEIVLVRRRVDPDHDEPHGGVWKVAFADFMTAMMAFFLVLWIVNSTSKETRVSVARYFNPVRLQEASPARKGVNDPNDATAEVEREQSKAPEALLNTAAGRGPTAASQAVTTSAGASEGGPIAEPRLQDPFARKPSASTLHGLKPSASAASEEIRERESVAARVKRDAEAIRAELAASLGEEFGKLGAALDVVASGDGLLISVTDRFDFGMFAVGSANPEARLMRVLEAIGATLQSRSGGVIIRGHTDARQYRAGGSDNWLLSAARAQAAHNVLLAGGLDDGRVERIEGYADHRLRTPATPEAPENRRIEIYLRQEKK
jgi:chemotaxis protein MotB